MTDQFELRRKIDDLVYSFTRRPRTDGLTGFQRADRDLWIVYLSSEHGWVAWDEENAAIAGRPWAVLPKDQSSNHPPEGEWVSKKGERSYVYDITHC